MFFLEILIVIAAYLIGSLSAAQIVSKRLGMPDPRSYGSGNPGASNVLRSGRADAAAWTLLGDALKGAVAVWLARAFYAGFDGIGAGVVACAAIAVVIGHMYPIFYGLKGGKGVATALGVLVGMSLAVTFWVVLIWAAVAFKFKKSSLAALTASIAAPFITFILLRNDHVTSWGWAVLFIAMLVIYRHKDNIKRLCSGNETDIGSTATVFSSTMPNHAHTPQTETAQNFSWQPETEHKPVATEKTEVIGSTQETAIAADSSQTDLPDEHLEEAIIEQAIANAQATQHAVVQTGEHTGNLPQNETNPTNNVPYETDTHAAIAHEPVLENSEDEAANAAVATKKRGRKKAADNTSHT